MPKLANLDMENYQNTASHFGFSGVGINKLTATEYTLCTVVVDKSGSVSSFENEINAVVAKVVESCRKSPRADNLLLRVVEFDHRQQELHGFKPLADCNVGDYTGANMMRPSGSTALFDVSLNAVESTAQYGKQLSSQDFMANGLVVVITDGDDNASKVTSKFIKQEIDKLKAEEALESITAILVGVNASGQIDKNLDQFKNEAGFDQYVNIGDASPNKLARLANFISKSISTASTSLGSGTSQTCTF